MAIDICEDFLESHDGYIKISMGKKLPRCDNNRLTRLHKSEFQLGLIKLKLRIHVESVIAR